MTKLHLDEPLGLAVHSLPSPQETAAEPPPRGRWKLIAIMVLCSLPVLASYLAYFTVRPQGKAGYGELVVPIRPVAQQTGLTLEGKMQPLAALKGQWLLVSVGPGSCAPDCQQRLFLQRQLRETLGKGKERVDWVWLVSDGAPVDASMHKPLGDAVVLRVEPSAVEEWLGVPIANAASYLFVVDPMGNTMMRFPAKFDGAGAAKARRDLESLLRASVSWDTPGAVNGMSSNPVLYNLSPLALLLLLGGGLALLPLAWVWLRKRRSTPAVRWQALTLLTLFLTFDLVLFGAFTRLTDSGLGCPDWPGCYGNASPLGANADIAAAQMAQPTGPVTHGKAWVEMVHRYLATSVGALIVVLTFLAWRSRKNSEPQVPIHWAVLTLLWVCLQGTFGALTVTMKLFPAIVSLHLLGGYVLLALLTVQWVKLTPVDGTLAPVVSAKLRLAMVVTLAWLVVQAASGAWVSTNYAVLACYDFPQCQATWWPDMALGQGFEIWRPLGHSADGTVLSFQALTGIHFVHRMLALVSVVVLGLMAWRLRTVAALQAQVQWLMTLTALQVLTGMGNVVLDWPLVAAVLHTGGAGALVVVLVWLLAATNTRETLEKAASMPPSYTHD